MFSALTGRSMLRLSVAAIAALALSAGAARADTQTKSHAFQLTPGDFAELSFTPSAPGTISAHANWSSDWFGPAVSLKMEIRKPDGTLAKDGSGGNPLPLSYTLTNTEFQQFKGHAWKVVVRNNSSQQANVTVSGTLKVTFPISTVTEFNNSASPMNLGSQGAETQVSFNTPNKAGQLVVEISFDDGIFHDLQLKAQLFRGNDVVMTKTGNNSIKLTFNVTPSGSGQSLGWKLKLTNNTAWVINNIKVVAKFTPNN
jgi:hypothetical protein